MRQVREGLWALLTFELKSFEVFLNETVDGVALLVFITAGWASLLDSKPRLDAGIASKGVALLALERIQDNECANRAAEEFVHRLRGALFRLQVLIRKVLLGGISCLSFKFRNYSEVDVESSWNFPTCYLLG